MQERANPDEGVGGKPVLWLPGIPPTPSQPPATCGPVYAVDGVRSSEMYEREVDTGTSGKGGGAIPGESFPAL